MTPGGCGASRGRPTDRARTRSRCEPPTTPGRRRPSSGPTPSPTGPPAGTRSTSPSSNSLASFDRERPCLHVDTPENHVQMRSLARTWPRAATASEPTRFVPRWLSSPACWEMSDPRARWSVQLVDVATASADVGASSARLAKIARIADLLTAPARTATRGWSPSSCRGCPASCRSARSASAGRRCARCRRRPHEPTLTVDGVDAAFTEIGAVAGKGSQARRAGLRRRTVRRGHRRRADVPAPAARRRAAPGRAGRGDGRRRRQGRRRARRRRCDGPRCWAAICPPSRPPR